MSNIRANIARNIRIFRANSGLNDYEEPHGNQNFTVAIFYRIISNN